MSRDAGFPIADTDTGLMSDPKVLALARRQRDPLRTLASVALWDAVRLASWKAGKRLIASETIPGWCLDPVDDLVTDLVAVRLLDDQERIPEHAFESWFGPARDRRERFRELGRQGGLATQERARDDRVPEQTVEPTPEGTVKPVKQAVSTVSPSSRPGGQSPPDRTSADAPEAPVLAWLAEHGLAAIAGELESWAPDFEERLPGPDTCRVSGHGCPDVPGLLTPRLP